MKKFMAIIFALILLFTIVGCNGQSEINLFKNYSTEMTIEIGSQVSLPEYANEYGVKISVNNPDGRAVKIENNVFSVDTIGKYIVNYTARYNGKEYSHRTTINVTKSMETKFSIEDGVVYKEDGRDFRILQLSDIQIIDPDLDGMTSSMYSELLLSATQRAKYRNKKDDFAYKYLRKLIENTAPDFIVLAGDNVYGQFDDGTNFVELMEFIDSYDIPWAYVNGNHDGEKHGLGVGLQWQLSYVINNLDNCFYIKGDVGIEESFGNYVVRIKDRDLSDFYSMYFLDTHSDSSEESRAHGIYTGQIGWYENTARAIAHENGVSVSEIPSLMFFHIPIYAYAYAMEQYHPGNNGVGKVPENNVGDYGENNSNVYTSSVKYDDGIFEKVVELGSTKGIFCGHTHVNSSSVLYQGVRLTFGMHSSLYDSHQGGLLGGTLITLNDQQQLKVSPYYLEN